MVNKTFNWRWSDSNTKLTFEAAFSAQAWNALPGNSTLLEIVVLARITIRVYKSFPYSNKETTQSLYHRNHNNNELLNS